MKRTNLLKVVGASILSLSIAVLPANIPAHAQDSTGNNGGSTTTTGTAPATTTNGTENRNGYWGLLGLLGLFGLIGRGHKGPTVAYRDPS